MSAKFGLLKQGIATGFYPAAVGSAQIVENQVRQYGEDSAERIVAKVAMGKCSIAFRLGHDVKERAEVIGYLVPMLESAVNRNSKRIVPFPEVWLTCIAAAAIDEATIDMCPSCWGAGEIRMAQEVEGRQPMTVCPSCGGRRTRKYGEEERVQKLAREWITVNGAHTSHTVAIAKELRRSQHLPGLLFGIEYAGGLIRSAEGTAVKETARMLERWGK